MGPFFSDKVRKGVIYFGLFETVRLVALSLSFVVNTKITFAYKSLAPLMYLLQHLVWFQHISSYFSGNAARKSSILYILFNYHQKVYVVPIFHKLSNINMTTAIFFICLTSCMERFQLIIYYVFLNINHDVW